MLNINTRLVPLATYDIMDEYTCGLGEAMRLSGHKTLATLAKEPGVIRAVNHGRDVADKDRWHVLCRHWKPSRDEHIAASRVLALLPGYCCLNDAAQLLARL